MVGAVAPGPTTHERKVTMYRYLIRTGVAGAAVAGVLTLAAPAAHADDPIPDGG